MLESIIESSKRSRFSAISSQPTKEKIKWKHELMDWGSRSEVENLFRFVFIPFSTCQSCPRCLSAVGLPCVFLSDLRKSDLFLRKYPGKIEMALFIVDFLHMTPCSSFCHVAFFRRSQANHHSQIRLRGPKVNEGSSAGRAG